MAKTSLVFFFFELIFIFIWLFFFGQANGLSALAGDINMIDEGQFAAWTSHMLHGKVVYKDFVVPYGPLQIYPYFFFVKLFGETMFSIRLNIAVVGVFFGLIVASLVLRNLKVHPVVRVITMFFLLLIPGVNIRNWIGILCILCVVQAYAKKSLLLSFIAGVLLIVSLLQSVEVFLFTAVIVLGYIFVRFVVSESLNKNMRLLGMIFLGCVSVLFPFALIAQNGGWLTSYIHFTSGFLSSVSGVNLPNGQGLPNIFFGNFIASPFAIVKFLFSKELLFYWSLFILLLFLATATIRFILRRAMYEDSLIFLILCFSLLTYASIVGRSGHFLVMSPFILICGSYYLSLIFPPRSYMDNIGKLLSYVCLILFLLYGIRHLIIFRYTLFFQPQMGSELQSSVQRVAPIAISKGQADDILALQRFIDTHSSPEDTIFVLNNIPALYFLLNRENATQYDLPLLAFSREKRVALVESLKRNQPKFIIEDQKAWAVDGVSDWKRLPEVAEYMGNHYEKSFTVNSFLIYKRILE